jgi:hypothetical protein
MLRMKNRISGIFEVVWFVLGGLMLFVAVDVTLNQGMAGSWYYYLLSLLAFVMYFLRRRMRITRR